MTKKQVIGPRIPRRMNANILEDMADIAEAVRNSGLPDEFFTDLCCVYDQLTALSQFMNLTPLQITLLAVIAEQDTRVVTQRMMADYIGCPKTRLLSYYWDFYFLEYIGLISSHKDNGVTSYELSGELPSLWSKDLLHHRIWDREAEGVDLLKRIAFKLEQYKEGVAGSQKELDTYLDEQFMRYGGAYAVRCLTVEFHECPAHWLCIRLLIMLAANYIFIEQGEVFSRDFISGFLCLPESSLSELGSVLEYCLEHSLIDKFDDDSYRASRPLVEKVGDLIGFTVPTMEEFYSYKKDESGDCSPMLKSNPVC